MRFCAKNSSTNLFSFVCLFFVPAVPAFSSTFSVPALAAHVFDFVVGWASASSASNVESSFVSFDSFGGCSFCHGLLC